MYYIKKPLGVEEAAHIHIKGNGKIQIKNFNDGVLKDVLLSAKLTEEMFGAKFRIVTNDDGSKTKIFM